MSCHSLANFKSRKQMRERSAARSGYTLLELLIVIAIIAVLAGLTSGVAIRWLRKGLEVKTTDEIQQLAAAVELFKREFRVSYLPSRILLREDGNYQLNSPDPIEADSLRYLKALWPGLRFPVDIDGDGKFDGAWTLEGDQCLVFFLGGIQTMQNNTPACLGFSRKRGNPWFRNPNAPRREPFFEFQSRRLIIATSMASRQQHTILGQFFTYLDPYGASDGAGQWQSGSPYAFFSAYGNRNGYNRYVQQKTTLGPDCSTIGGTMWPYAEAIDSNGDVRYLNPETIQIISAGADGRFALGTELYKKNPYVWNTGTATGIPENGRDDRSNFAPQSLFAGP